MDKFTGMAPRVVSKEEIAKLLSMEECIGAMEDAFREVARGESYQPLRSLMWLPDKSGLLGMMPGYAMGRGVMGIKVITVFHKNRDAGLPSHQGSVLLYDTAHGTPLLIADAEEITSIRTAAASGLATRLLARKDASRLAILGAGEQAERHMEAMVTVRPITEAWIWNRSENKAIDLAKKLSARYRIAVTARSTAKEAVEHADIICTVTSSYEPVLHGEWIAQGTHINAVGACTPNARELDTLAVRRSSLFTDAYESIFREAGDFIIPKQEAVIDDSHVKAELSELVSGTKTGRASESEVTLFKSLGLALEDIYAAWHILKRISL